MMRRLKYMYFKLEHKRIIHYCWGVGKPIISCTANKYKVKDNYKIAVIIMVLVAKNDHMMVEGTYK